MKVRNEPWGGRVGVRKRKTSLHPFSASWVDRARFALTEAFCPIRHDRPRTCSEDGHDGCEDAKNALSRLPSLFDSHIVWSELMAVFDELKIL